MSFAMWPPRGRPICATSSSEKQCQAHQGWRCDPSRRSASCDKQEIVEDLLGGRVVTADQSSPPSLPNYHTMFAQAAPPLTTPQFQIIVGIIETKASLYAMTLNNTKTELLNHPDHPPAPLYFMDGSGVPVVVVDQVKSLGSHVS